MPHSESPTAALVYLPGDASSDIVDYPDEHPVVVYFKSDTSVLWVQVLIEDGTLIKYEPLVDL